MSEFNFDEPEPKPSGFSAPAIGVWDIFTIIVLLLTVCLGVYFIMVFLDPGSSLNPLKPAILKTPTATITPLQMETYLDAYPDGFLSPTATLLPLYHPSRNLHARQSGSSYRNADPDEHAHLLLPPQRRRSRLLRSMRLRVRSSLIWQMQAVTGRA